MTKAKFGRGCGYTCPFRDTISGICERHGPTEIDRIVDRVTEAFRADVKRIMASSLRARSRAGARS